MGLAMPGGGAGARRGGRRRAAKPPLSEINVTPFVDVMLVLLIIFMVAAPLLTVGVPLELPDTAAEPLEQEDQEPLTLSLAADGRVVVQEAEVPRAELIARLTAIAGERRDEKIFLRADGGLPYADVAEVMGALNAAGFTSIGLVTDGGGPRLDGAASEGN